MKENDISSAKFEKKNKSKIGSITAAQIIGVTGHKVGKKKL